MDYQFSSKLQTALHLFGREGDFAPPKSQDPADRILHEYFVTDQASSLFKKRREDAKEAVIAQADQETVQRVIANAVKQNAMQSTTIAATEHYNAILKAAKPVESVDAKKMVTELMKLGVKDDIIRAALDAATSTREPAKTLMIATTNARD
jgi:ATP-dependent DNA ligase